ncbi:hypothetical protein R3P38DRAFT_3288328 [Favolaschia claudopus]|uniref:Uncharacterized protein n=1 Tax=Favolaschia claudopus TaxID=2862362 RepID=A0AAV9ZX02_9AGAR
MPQVPFQAWTPRLRPWEEDATIFSSEPFASVFLNCSKAPHTRSSSSKDFLLRELSPVLNTPENTELLDDWLIFTIGYAVLPAQALEDCRKLFLNVLYIRFQHDGNRRQRTEGDQLAHKAIEAAQISYIKQYCSRLDDRPIPADFCWEQDLEGRDNTSDVEDELESEDEDEDYDNDPMDTDFQPDDDPESPDEASDEEVSDEEPEDTAEPLHPSQDFIRKVPKPNVLPRKKPNPPSVKDYPALTRSWARHINEFFFPVDPSSAILDDEQIRSDLVVMKLVKRSNEFLSELKNSQLFELMREVARPGNLIETKHPRITLSFRFLNWRTSYSELICKWVKPTLTEEEYKRTLPQADPNYPIDQAAAIRLLDSIGTNPRMQPWGFNPMAVFLFFSLDTFQANCAEWLVPCLKKLQYPWLEGWHTERVYRSLMNLKIFSRHRYFSVKDKLPFESRDPRFRTVIRETANYRYFMTTVKNELFRPAPLATPATVPIPSSSSQSPAPSLEDDSDDTGSDETTAHDAGAAAAASRKKRKKGKQSETSKRRARRRRAKEEAEASGSSTPHLEQEPEQKTKPERTPGTSTSHTPPAHMPANLNDLPNSCPHCANLPMKERCIRYYQVHYRDCRSLIGGALTSAPLNDRLQPKPPPKPKEGEKPKPQPKPRYFHPYKDLKMRLVKFRPSVYERCGKDVVRFVWIHADRTWEYVGGVRFKPFSEETLEQLLYNHSLVIVRAIRRRAIMQIWAYGTMTAAGSRQPVGGAKGDTYGPYASHRGDTEDDAIALFREGADADILIEVGDTIVPGLQAELTRLTKMTNVNYLGSTGVCNFTCTNYISCIHPDSDISLDDKLHGRKKKDGLGGLTPCVQLEKTGCGPHDYDFGYVRWGVVVRTMTNTVWLFNGRHEHGTDMPAQSVMAKAKSKGKHATKPARNSDGAQRVNAIRHGYNVRTAVV